MVCTFLYSGLECVSKVEDVQFRGYQAAFQGAFPTAYWLHSSRATAKGRRDQPGLESEGFARRCRRFRFAE